MVAYESLRTKEKSSCLIPKVVAVANETGRLRELFIIKFKLQLKRGITKAVATREVARRASNVGAFGPYGILKRLTSSK